MSELCAVLVAVTIALTASNAAGQVCVIRPETTYNDGGWSGPDSELTCNFAQTDLQVFCQLRPIAGVYGGPGSFAGLLPGGAMAPIPLQHRAVYALRGKGVFSDGGDATALGPESIITADNVAPTLLGIPVVDQIDGGTFHLSWAPSFDDGEGNPSYESSFRFANVSRDGDEGGPTSVTTPELRTDLGPGTWIAQVQVVDVVRNYGGVQASAPFVITADPSVTPPPPPVLSAAIFPTISIDFDLSEPADVYHFIGVEPDGGVFAGTGNRTEAVMAPFPQRAYGYLGRECSFRMRASRTVGGRTSDWSAPSAEFKVDLFPPSAPPSVSVSVNGGTLLVAWGSATDSCSGVKHYVVERSDGTNWTSLNAPVVTLQITDTPPGAGMWRYRVLAVDYADHVGAPTESSDQRWPLTVDAGSDAGVDAGRDAGVDAGADAGVDAGADAGVDAGVEAGADGGADVDAGRDAGAGETPPERRYSVGCGCTSVDGEAALLAITLAALGARRRRRIDG